MMTALTVLLILAVLWVLSVRGRRGHPGLEPLRGWVYAHRGLFGDGVPENSMAAFRRALEAGYGVELDVHLLADGSLAVIHDSLLVRTTGLEGRIEDLTEAQLGQCFLEGTEETIPTLEQVLELFAGKAPIILELKSVRGNDAALCAGVCAALDAHPGTYCLESFDPRSVYWLRKHRPDLVRGQLTENYFRSKTNLSFPQKCLLSAQMTNFLTLPDFVACPYSDRKTPANRLAWGLWKLQGVTWTLRCREELEQAGKEALLPIFEGFAP